MPRKSTRVSRAVKTDKGIRSKHTATKKTSAPAATHAVAVQESAVLKFSALTMVKKIHSLSKMVANKHTTLSAGALCMVIAAQATLIRAPAIGIYINAAALVGLTAIALANNKLRNLALSLGIIPVANMALASVSTQHPNGLTNTLVYDGLLLSLAAIYRLIFTPDSKATAAKINWKQLGILAPLMIVLGQVIGVIGYAFLGHHYLFTGYKLTTAAGMAALFAVCEEVFFRGLIQKQASKFLHPIGAAIGTAALYVTLGLAQNTLLNLPVSVTLAIALTLTYYKTKNLGLTILLNLTAKLAYVGLVTGFIL